jgi:hypothetical protein
MSANNGALPMINIPTKDGLRKATGRIALLYVGNIQHKFYIQDTETSEKVLTHYASGMKLGSLTPIKMKHFKNYSSLKDREAAKILLQDLIDKHGVDRVTVKLNSAQVIN